MRIVTVVIVLLAATAAGVAGQDARAFGRLRSGQIVRVTLLDGSGFVTHLGEAPRDSVAALFALASTPFSLHSVDSLWVRGTAMRTGAIVGAVAGTSLSFGVVLGLCTNRRAETGCLWGAVAAFSLVTGAGSALIGTFIGAIIPKWHLRYARDRRVSIRPTVAPGQAGIAITL